MKLGRERRKAWVYSAINPILEALRIESGFLAKGNWTFRQETRDLEFIRPLEAYVDYQSRPNWEDFVSSNPSVQKSLTQRDKRREELRNACSEAFDYLVGVQRFRQKVSDCLTDFQRWEGGNLGQDPQNAVAELIVNNVSQLPSHYRHHSRFWSRFRDDFMEFRLERRFRNADQAGDKLKTSNHNLSAKLTKVRGALAAEYDIPWAPYYDESLSLPGR